MSIISGYKLYFKTTPYPLEIESWTPPPQFHSIYTFFDEEKVNIGYKINTIFSNIFVFKRHLEYYQVSIAIRAWTGARRGVNPEPWTLQIIFRRGKKNDTKKIDEKVYKFRNSNPNFHMQVFQVFFAIFHPSPFLPAPKKKTELIIFTVHVYVSTRLKSLQLFSILLWNFLRSGSSSLLPSSRQTPLSELSPYPFKSKNYSFIFSTSSTCAP